jgi:hypothetical protein
LAQDRARENGRPAAVRGYASSHVSFDQREDAPVDKPSTPNGRGQAAGQPPGAGSRGHPKLGSGSESVVVASFANRHAAEHLLASLGRDFRKKARKGGVAAFLITVNADGSFSLVQSRVLTASGVVAAGIGVGVASMAGLLGLMSALRGGKTVVHAARERETHVGAETQRLRDILAEAGPRASVAVVRCADPGEAAAVVSLAAERARDSWHGSRAEFVTVLDQAAGSYGWLRAALDEPPKDSG